MTMEELLPLLCCPRCRGRGEEAALEASSEALRCTSCGAEFPIEHGIPNFLAREIRSGKAPAAEEARQKWQQRTWHDTHELEEWNIVDPHHAPLKEYCLYRQMGAAADLMPSTIAPRHILNICCGSGLEAEFFSRRFNRPVIGTDISMGLLRNAVERARRGGYPFAAACADSENLPFRTRVVDAAIVLHGLHHLHQPARGLREMARVSTGALLIFEPATSPVRELMMRLGVVSRVEEAGNVSYDFSEASGFQQVLREEGFTEAVFRRELWSLSISELKLANRAPLFGLAKAAYEFLHRSVARRWGTKLSLVAWRR